MKYIIFLLLLVHVYSFNNGDIILQKTHTASRTIENFFYNLLGKPKVFDYIHAGIYISKNSTDYILELNRNDVPGLTPFHYDEHKYTVKSVTCKNENIDWNSLLHKLFKLPIFYMSDLESIDIATDYFTTGKIPDYVNNETIDLKKSFSCASFVSYVQILAGRKLKNNIIIKYNIPKWLFDTPMTYAHSNPFINCEYN